MQDEKWYELLDSLSQKFKIEKQKEEIISKDDLGNEIISNVESIEFKSDLGEFKIERTVRPMILDKKVHYSHTAGTKGLVEYVLSPDEKTYKVTLFKKDEDDKWQEIPMSAEGMRF